ncbi:MAG: hypothetical protein HC828_06110, partial [Blastochloris sp.]|nr:hypothetical protein [Blastochloris sp.]
MSLTTNHGQQTTIHQTHRGILPCFRAGVLWRLLRALHTHTRRDWLIFGVIALLSVFVHRLAILILIAAWASYLLVNAHRSTTRLVRTPNRTG